MLWIWVIGHLYHLSKTASYEVGWALDLNPCEVAVA